MSGGAYNYAYRHVDEFVTAMPPSGTGSDRLCAFRCLLLRVSKAMHDVEWAASGDCSWERAHESIDDLFRAAANGWLPLARAERAERASLLLQEASELLRSS